MFLRSVVITAALTIPASGFGQMIPGSSNSLQLYGRMDLAVTGVRYSNESNTRKAVSSDGSLFGFKGTEQLGDGFATYFKLEAGINGDTGAMTNANQFFNRESFVGIGGEKTGYVSLGFHYGPGIWLASRMDPFARQQMGLSQNILQGPANRGYTAVLTNSVEYVTPDFHGFRAHSVVQAGEGATAGGGSLAGDYVDGNLYIGAVYDNVSVAGTTVGLARIPLVRDRNLGVGATYLMKPVKLAAYVQRNSTDGGLPSVHSYLVGATFYAGLGEIRTSYIKVNNPGAHAAQGSLGYIYFLSKSTQVYTTATRILNHGKAKFSIYPDNVDFTTSPLPAGQAESGLEFGLRYLF